MCGMEGRVAPLLESELNKLVSMFIWDVRAVDAQGSQPLKSVVVGQANTVGVAVTWGRFIVKLLQSKIGSIVHCVRVFPSNQLFFVCVILKPIQIQIKD